jgi:hypothetical protein
LRNENPSGVLVRLNKKQKKANHYSPDTVQESTDEKEPTSETLSTGPDSENKTERTEEEKRYDIDAGLS